MRRALLLAAWAIVACDDATNLARQVAELELGATQLAFGATPLGATRRLTVEVRNVGTAPLDVEALTVGQPFSVEPLTESGRVPFTVEAGQAVVLDVAFLAEQIDPVDDVIDVATSAGSGSVRVTGEGEASQVVVTPERVDFRGLELGNQTSVELRFEQRGPGDVAGELVTEGFGRPVHFGLDGFEDFAAPGAVALAPRAELVTEFTYAPILAGDDSGRIRFEFCGERCGAEVEVAADAGSSFLVFEPPAVDFGQVGLGETVTVQVLAQNQGTEPIELRQLMVEGDESYTIEARPDVLEAGALLPILITYAPSEPREQAADVVVVTEGRFSSRRIPVVGRGIGPRFDVLPDVVSFGLSDQMDDVQQAMLLSNSGSSQLSVESMQIVGDAAFSLDAPRLPLVLGGGESSFATVRFRPTRLGTYSATVSVASTDPNLPSVDVPVRAAIGQAFCDLVLQPEVVNFGLVRSGRGRTQSVRLENLGDQACTLDLTLADPVDVFFRISSEASLVLGPRDVAFVELEFRPDARRTAKAILELRTNDPILPRRRVSLLGTSEGYAELIVLPEAIDFGQRRLDCQAARRSVRLINTGLDTIEVTDVSWDPGDVALTVGAPRSTVLRGGEEQAWTVRYAPEERVSQGELRFDFEALPFPLFVPVQGEGVQDARRTDVFTQRTVRETDVLFVIDDSCSMFDDQEALARNVDSFIDQADLRGARFRIGITTTSAGILDGNLVGQVIDGERVSRSSAVRAFNTQAIVGTAGSGFEQPLESALRVLERADQDTDINKGLLDRQAVLAVVVVTDEDDFSPASVPFYFQQLTSLTPDGLVTAVVAGGEFGCGTAIPSPRLLDFLAFTNGTFLSICGDWGDNLESLGEVAFGLSARFELVEPVDDTEPIEVRVDGLSVAGWTYDPTINSIVFDEPPTEGSRIEVDYSPACP
jgi:hypothetical protein